MPGSFFGRSLLILLLPLLLLQVVSAYVFYNRHWEDVGRRLALGLGGEISILVEAIEAHPDEVDRDCGTGVGDWQARRRWWLSFRLHRWSRA